MNRKQISAFLWMGCWICLFPASYGMCFVLPALFKPGADQPVAWGIVLIFAFGLFLMRGYRRLWRDRQSWPGEGWIWGLTALANAVPSGFLVWELVTMRTEEVESLAHWNSNTSDLLVTLLSLFLCLWWPTATALAGWAWGQWFWSKSLKSPDPSSF